MDILELRIPLTKANQNGCNYICWRPFVVAGVVKYTRAHRLKSFRVIRCYSFPRNL
jgi:hypothetical protein